MDIRHRFGTRLKALREGQGLSQEELAHRAELHRTYISGLERGVRNPTLTVLEKLAHGLGITVPALMALD